ncbi:hypothetical protein C8R43DRAFT_530402 [Mycena crocata]|nr:hypothetical protein C8R43DRAFT_530402 [Mycena crocata]
MGSVSLPTDIPRPPSCLYHTPPLRPIPIDEHAPHLRAALPVPRTQKRRRIRRALCVCGSQSASASAAMHSSKCGVCADRVAASCNVAPGSLPRPCAPCRVPHLCRVPTSRPRRHRSRSLLPKSEHRAGPTLLRSPLVPTRSAQIPLTRWNSALTASFASSRGCCFLAAASASFASSPVLPSTAPERGVRRRETNQIRVETCKNESVKSEDLNSQRADESSRGAVNLNYCLSRMKYCLSRLLQTTSSGVGGEVSSC